MNKLILSTETLEITPQTQSPPDVDLKDEQSLSSQIRQELSIMMGQGSAQNIQPANIEII